MNDDAKIRDFSAKLRQQLRDTYGVRGRSLPVALRRAGRLLPKSVQAQVRIVIEAEQALGNPALERMHDISTVKNAHDTVSAHLDSIDVADMRRGKLLSLAGTIAFNLILVVALFIIWLVWSGQL